LREESINHVREDLRNLVHRIDAGTADAITATADAYLRFLAA
jgi:hypothetical protein